MKRVFADTHFYLALLNREDPAHEEAMAWVGAAADTAIVTTGWIVVETANAMSKSHRRRQCGVFLSEIYRSERTTVVA
ncbi:MAG TPA: hypothetical protein VEO95_02825, partial [Chthoniobacteraceae bacterium]|nr:hypothetical protein [Chthoniobacteraceae bacterium]